MISKLNKKKSENCCRSVTKSSFNFKEYCIFCGENCIQFNKRYPDRWRRVVYCRTADRGKKLFKETILKTCSERNRVRQATGDLHAANGQYHKDCFSSLKCNKH